MWKWAWAVEADERRAGALAAWLDAAGWRMERCADTEQLVARAQAGQAAAWVIVDLDGAPDALDLLRSFRCLHDLPPLLGLAHHADVERTAAALADGVVLVLDWATPADAARQALQASPRPAGAEPLVGHEAFEPQLAMAGLQLRIGLAQAIEQQGRRLLQEAVLGLLTGRDQQAAAAAARLEQVALRLGAASLARACRPLAQERCSGLLLQQRAARVRRELDHVVCALGRAALQAPQWLREGDTDGLPGISY